jgi:FKBP-type peptidyl-prolyl cis-trans isomerase
MSDKCWDIVSERMSVGEKITVICPSNLAYGERGAGNDIPPNSDLLFEMELIEIVERYT